MAPEIIRCEGHDKAVDWWALGIIIYEMLVGYTPFFDEDAYVITEKILKEEIKWPRKINQSAKELIAKLLERDKSNRLGSALDGSEHVKSQEYVLFPLNISILIVIIQILQRFSLG